MTELKTHRKLGLVLFDAWTSEIWSATVNQATKTLLLSCYPGWMPSKGQLLECWSCGILSIELTYPDGTLVVIHSPIRKLYKLKI